SPYCLTGPVRVARITRASVGTRKKAPPADAVASRVMQVGVPKESTAGERRVALVPCVLAGLGEGVDVVVEHDAGTAAGFPDDAYTDAGATVGDPWSADVVVKVAPP